MEIKYFELAYEDIEQISRMESKFFSTPWSEASIGHYAEAGNTIFVVARNDEPYVSDAMNMSAASGNAANVTANICDVHREEDLPRRVVGYAAVLCAADEGNLVSIGVEEDCREMGIATELLDIAYEMALERGVTSINLEVRESNEPAITMYEKEGFVKVGKRPNFYRNPTEDALLYIKQIGQE